MLYRPVRSESAGPHRFVSHAGESHLEAHGFGLDRYIAQPLLIQDGFVVAPDRPGHAIEFDWKALETCQA